MSDNNQRRIQHEELQEIFNAARNDPFLASQVDVDELLESLNDDKYDYIQDKTLSELNDEIYEIGEEENIEPEIIQKLLNNYRYVDDFSNVHIGKHTRWIRKSDHKLTNGSILLNMDFMEDGTQLLLKNTMQRFMRIKWDQCIVFQKLTPEEYLIACCNQEIHREC